MGSSDITLTDSQDEIIGPFVIQGNRKKVSKRTNDEADMNLFSGYSDPLFQDSESYLRTVIVFVEDDIPLVLKRSGFIRYE